MRDDEAYRSNVRKFRAYQQPTRIEFGGLTTVIGRNDIGKSTILEALEVFFNGEAVKIEQSDANVRSDLTDVSITAEFSDLPAEITLDAGAMTRLADEYLVAANGNLIIRKVYDCGRRHRPRRHTSSRTTRPLRACPTSSN